jgi:hypothetical protein
MIVPSSSPSTDITLLIYGQASKYQEKVDPPNQQLFGPGDWFGNLKEFIGTKYMHIGVVAVTDCVAYTICIKSLVSIINVAIYIGT